MNKEEFIKVLNASLLMYNGLSAIDTEKKINDNGAIVIAKLLNRFITSYDKKNDDFKVEEKEDAPKPKPIEELKEINKEVEQPKERKLTFNESKIKEKIVDEITEMKSSDVRGGVVEISANTHHRGRILF